MRQKLIRHKWKKLDGFRRHECEVCGCIRYWDPAYRYPDGSTGTLMYSRRYYLNSEAPGCFLPNTKIN